MPTEIFSQCVELIGGSAVTERARVAVARAAGTTDPVLISAEAGLDPATVARDIHRSSSRGAGPLVCVNCAAQDAIAVERELAGSAALGGSLLLEHLDELSAPLQARLARMLRDGQKNGDAANSGGAGDARMIATVHGDVEEHIGDGTLLRELCAQFGVRVDLPPLRHRSRDIPTLIGCLVGESATASGVPVPTFSREALTLLAALPWRRNVDELREVLDVLVLGAVGSTVRLEDVLGHVSVERVTTADSNGVSLREARRHFERQYITSVLQRHRGRMDDAARSLGVQRTNLYRKVRQLGIARTKS